MLHYRSRLYPPLPAAPGRVRSPRVLEQHMLAADSLIDICGRFAVEIDF